MACKDQISAYAENKLRELQLLTNNATANKVLADRFYTLPFLERKSVKGLCRQIDCATAAVDCLDRVEAYDVPEGWVVANSLMALAERASGLANRFRKNAEGGSPRRLG